MLKKLLNLKVLIAVAILATFVGAALAQTESPAAPQAPDAVRVRFAHLAPFPGSSSDVMTVTIDGNPVAGEMQYGEFIGYQTLPGIGTYTIAALRNGAPYASASFTIDVEGDSTIAIIGNLDETPAQVWRFPDTTDQPDIGKTKLRVIHVAPIGYTLADTSVDICSQLGVSFTPTGNDLRYRELTIFKILNPGEYNLKVTDWIEGSAVFCTGPTVIDPAPITLIDGSITTLYVVGDDTNQPKQMFSIELGGLLPNEDPGPATGSITVVKQLVGAAPGADWQFTGGLGAFTLPAAGGQQLFSNLAAGSYQIVETATSGYTTTVSCTNGAAGTNSVTVTLNAADNVTCTFVNTETIVTPPPATESCSTVSDKFYACVPAVVGSPNG